MSPRNVPIHLFATVAVFAVSGLLAACAELAPDAIVTGAWGGHRIGLVADESEALLDLLCVGAATEGPLVLDAAGTFRDTALVAWRSFAGGPRDWRLVLRGEALDGVMDLTITWIWDGRASEQQAYTLYRGADPDFSDLGCLAASAAEPSDGD